MCGITIPTKSQPWKSGSRLCHGCLMESDVLERHRKQLAVMRGWLEGKQFFLAAEALETVRNLELGFRKDGRTPKFHHQLSVARLVSTLTPHLLYPEEAVAVAFLHDILEDHGDIWNHQALSAKFGQRVADAVWRLTKKSQGLTKSQDSYFTEMAQCPIASIVKLADRSHNLQTMQGVFDLRKQEEYAREVEELFYPMIKTARRSYPKQYGAYENLKILMRCQVRLIEQNLQVERLRQTPADILIDDLTPTLRQIRDHLNATGNDVSKVLAQKLAMTLELIQQRKNQGG